MGEVTPPVGKRKTKSSPLQSDSDLVLALQEALASQRKELLGVNASLHRVLSLVLLAHGGTFVIQKEFAEALEGRETDLSLDNGTDGSVAVSLNFKECL